MSLSMNSIWPTLGLVGSIPRQPAGLRIIHRPLLKLYIYGYLNRVQSSRRLEREAGRNVEVMWLTGRLARSQDDCRLPQGQWQCHPQGLRNLSRCAARWAC
jgi:hypothetical protein